MMLRQDTENLEIRDHPNNMISFDEVSQNHCVGIVDVVNSTQTVSRLSKEQSCEFYSVFLNTVGYVIENNGGKVVKNMGDGILFYFPKSIDSNHEIPIKCGKKILEATKMINDIFRKRKIPSIQYRVSLDYGPIMIARYSTSSCRDVFGPTVNLCSKINHLAKPDGLVIGGDLYQIVKKSKRYEYNEVSVFATILKQDYSVYSVK
ncbi:MAG: adenylate/guanylate cyclase domain-containing protein [Nitrosopumilus sp.]